MIHLYVTVLLFSGASQEFHFNDRFFTTKAECLEFIGSQDYAAALHKLVMMVDSKEDQIVKFIPECQSPGLKT